MIERFQNIDRNERPTYPTLEEVTLLLRRIAGARQHEFSPGTKREDVLTQLSMSVQNTDGLIEEFVYMIALEDIDDIPKGTPCIFVIDSHTSDPTPHGNILATYEQGAWHMNEEGVRRPE